MFMKDIRVYSIDYNGPLQHNDTRTVAKLEPKIKELCTGLIRQISITKKGFDSSIMKKFSNANITESASVLGIDLNIIDSYSTNYTSVPQIVF